MLGMMLNDLINTVMYQMKAELRL